MQWDGRISAGNLLTVAAIVVSITLAWARLEAAVSTEHEVRQQEVQQVVASISQLSNALQGEESSHQIEMSQFNQRLTGVEEWLAAVSQAVGAPHPVQPPAGAP